ncbi:hypothetical protein FMJ71_27100 [Klebsiella grimontii]|nr:hypothetical protein [Klebsiella grimontii]
MQLFGVVRQIFLTIIIHYNKCPNARMPECPNARMPECPNARMPECPNARMPECPLKRLYDTKYIHWRSL